MIPRMLVLVNPHEKELTPLVRFEPLNGFSVRHGNIKGAWRTNIKDAVEDYNGSVERALKRLRLNSFTPETFPLASLAGVDSAFREFQLANPPKPAKEAPAGCGCPECKDDATRAPEYRRKPSAPAGGGLLGLVAMLAAIGALDGFLDDEEGPHGEKPFLLDAMPEMAELLGKRGLLHRTGPNSAIVALPRKWGEALIVEIEDAIRNGNLAAVDRLTSILKP